MGEIDTKPIESVQAALSLFEEKTEQRKTRPTGTDRECEKERELEGVLKDLANYKVQLEAKDAAYMQALVNLEHHQSTAVELSTLLRNIEIERDKYLEECKGARTQACQLESKVREMADQLSQTVKEREQLLHVFSELKATQAELLSMETQLADARDSELKALTQAELMENELRMEEERTGELLKRVSELNDATHVLKIAAVEAEKEKLAMLSEKDAEIELATQASVQAQQQLEDMRKQTEMMQDLENKLFSKSSCFEILQFEFEEVKEELRLSEKAASDAIDDLKQLQGELEVKERKNLNQEGLIEALEMELNQLKIELVNANEEANRLKGDIEILTGDLHKAQTEIEEVRERENKAQVEIALLEAELHRGRSKIAAAEAAEARTDSVKSGLYLAIQQLAIEAQSAKKENRMLKEGADREEKETDEHSLLVNPHSDKDAQDVEVSEIDELKAEAEETKNENDAQVTISLKEYESWIMKAEKAGQIPLSLEEGFSQLSTMDNKSELETLKNELGVAMEKIAQFRNRAEQAVTRADLAEQAKAGLEEKIKHWREHKQKRKAALAALREVTKPPAYEYDAPTEFNPPAYEYDAPTELNPPIHDETRKKYQPLGKVLNMKL